MFNQFYELNWTKTQLSKLLDKPTQSPNIQFHLNNTFCKNIIHTKMTGLELLNCICHFLNCISHGDIGGRIQQPFRYLERPPLSSIIWFQFNNKLCKNDILHLIYFPFAKRYRIQNLNCALHIMIELVVAYYTVS